MSLESWKAEFYPILASDVKPEEARDCEFHMWTGFKKENLERHDLKQLGKLIYEANHDYITIDASMSALCHHYRDSDLGTCGACPARAANCKTCAEAYSSAVHTGNPDKMLRWLMR